MVFFVCRQAPLKMKHLILKDMRAFYTSLRLPKCFGFCKYIYLWWCLSSHRIDLWKCPPVRRTCHKKLRNVSIAPLLLLIWTICVVVRGYIVNFSPLFGLLVVKYLNFSMMLIDCLEVTGLFQDCYFEVNRNQ